MSEDERAIRAVVDAWMAASRAGDVEAVLGLMAEDAVFMTPGREPFGKQAFAKASEGMKGLRIEGTNEIVELQVEGRLAFTRNRIAIAVTPPGGETMRRSGYTLTLFRKEADGAWRLARDANLMLPGG